MSHGEQWIVPANFVMIALTVLFWAIFLPLWSTVLIAVPIAAVLAYFARDKYGGMQICLLVTFGWFAATAGAAKVYRHAVESHTELPLGQVVLLFIATIVVLPIVLFVALAVVAGILIAWEWLCGKLWCGKR
jgi:hypothetical protein